MRRFGGGVEAVLSEEPRPGSKGAWSQADVLCQCLAMGSCSMASHFHGSQQPRGRSCAQVGIPTSTGPFVISSIFFELREQSLWQ